MTCRRLFDRIDQRIQDESLEGDQAHFNALMLKFEYLTKIVVSAIVSCIADGIDRHRYTLEHRLVRANSLGEWMAVLDDALVGPPAQSFLPDAHSLRRDLLERVGPPDWRHEAVLDLARAAKSLDAGHEIGSKVALRQFFEIGVRIRNRTRGHGATTASQCSEAVEDLQAALGAVVSYTKLFDLSWVHLHQNQTKKYRVTPLLSASTPFDYLRRTDEVRMQDGVYFHLHSEVGAPSHIRVPTVFTNPEMIDLWLPNGNYLKSSFELLSYVTNNKKRHETQEWSNPPARLPESETEGGSSLEPMGNMFGNVPEMSMGYVARVDLEDRLVQELSSTDRHPIVTLTGPGGIGKTTVAIKAIREIASQKTPPYDVSLWISARDVDLLDTGPKPVSRRVFAQRDIADAAVQLLEPNDRKSRNFNSEAYFQRCLSEGAAGRTLFVIDNFETLKDPTDVLEWIDAHVRPPNKVLITTRFRDFRGDYPLEIKGMSDDEASALIDQHANRLGVKDLIRTSYREKLIAEAEGHPYVIKILLGEVAKERRAIKPKRIVASADQLLNALFKRTFDALSPGAQRVFLLLCSWRVYVPEVAVEAVAFRQGAEKFNVRSALEETTSFSLVDYVTGDDADERFVGVPLAAAMFGQRELEVSPLRVSIEEDRALLMCFGAGKRSDAKKGAFPRVENLLKQVESRAKTRPSELDKFLPILEYLGNQIPRSYLKMADLLANVRRDDLSMEKAKNYIRRFLQSANPLEQEPAWKKIVELCRRSDDVKGEVHALCEIALLPTSDQHAVSDVASQLNRRIRDLKSNNVEDAWSPEVLEFLERVICVLEQQIDRLSATDCSRLAWLHLNVQNEERALFVARAGISRNPNNDHCQSLIKKLET